MELSQMNTTEKKITSTRMKTTIVMPLHCSHNTFRTRRYTTRADLVRTLPVYEGNPALLWVSVLSSLHMFCRYTLMQYTKLMDMSMASYRNGTDELTLRVE